jgi:hypothetical protein
MNFFSTKCVRAFLNLLAITALLSGVTVAQDKPKTQDTAKQDAPKQDAKKEDAKKEESKVATVEVTPAQATAEAGDKVQFKAIGRDVSGNVLPDAVKFWYAAPRDIAGADANGLVIAILPGEVIVGASMGGKVGYGHILVTRPHIAKIDLIAPVTELSAGDVAPILATPRNSNGDPRTDIALTWTSDSPGIATVDAAGVVHAIKPGKAKILAAGDGKSASAIVTVGKEQVKSVAISPANASTKTGDVLHFAAVRSTSHGNARGGITWSVAGDGAQVFSDGAFVAERPGTYIYRRV